MEYEDEDEGESFAWASFTNVPIQITVMEKCEGTLYELMKDNDNKEKHLAWLSQVVFALAYAQRNFGFVHNDLHSNNVMYVRTEKEFLYYNFGGVSYKVPTFGYIIKIIDFERAVASVKLVGMKEAKFFMSDHFSVNDEAGGQYNYAPFYNQKYPEIKPNPSFDLVRLATSIFWDLYPKGPSHAEYETDPVFQRIKKWLTLEDGTSILFGKEDPRHDRYHGFTLYKAIARYCRDTAVPRKELVNLKSVYETQSVPAGEPVLVIDS
jgi:serine/threonine protein kinase